MGLAFLSILEMVRSETSKASFNSSPWIRGAPQSGLADAISSMICLILKSTGGRPVRFFRDLSVQKSLPFLCQRMTVSGCTTTRGFFQPFHSRERITQKRRPLLRIFGRFIDSRITINCCRRARFSMRSFLFRLCARIMKKTEEIIVSIIP